MLLVLGAATALRLYRLGHWGFEGDEINTLRDSINSPGLRGPKPLLFVLNDLLIGSWTTFDEVTLRALPVLFGLAGVLTVFLATRSILDARAGVGAAFIVAVSSWHVYWSQYARYYTLVFFLSAVYPLALYLGFRRRNWGWTALGALCAVLAIFAHPSAGLLLGAIIVWLFIAALAHEQVRHWLRTRSGISITAAFSLLVLTLLLWKLLPELRQWSQLRQDWGHHGLPLVLSFADRVSPIAGVLALGGLVWMWSAGERALALLLVMLVGIPVAFLVVVSYVVPVSTAYLFATTPAIAVLGGYLLAKCLDVGPRPGGIPLITAVCAAVLLAAQAPALASHYRDGSRLDFRSAAAYLGAQAASSDLIVSDQDRLLRHYLPVLSILPFRRDSSYLTALAADSTPALWIVVANVRRGGFNDGDLGAAGTWVHGACAMRRTFGRPRLDFRHNEVQVFECPAREASSALAASGRP